MYEAKQPNLRIQTSPPFSKKNIRVDLSGVYQEQPNSSQVQCILRRTTRVAKKSKAHRHLWNVTIRNIRNISYALLAFSEHEQT